LNVSLVTIKRSWTPRVRYAARKYRRDHKRAFRHFEKAVLCANEAKVVLDLLNRLGYGTGKNMAKARDRLELELMVHERDVDASVNFFRLYLAQKKDLPIDQVFTRRGRKRSQEEAEALRAEHMTDLNQALTARTAAHSWLSLYFSRTELGKKYGEFTRVQFDETLENKAKAAYLTLLFAQIAQRTGRTPEKVLAEFNRMVEAAGLEVVQAEVDEDEDENEE